jgi:isopenicillin-N epimerase
MVKLDDWRRARHPDVGGEGARDRPPAYRLRPLVPGIGDERKPQSSTVARAASRTFLDMDFAGRALLDEWLLDPGITYLNHGTVGATPRRVLAAQRAIQDEIERQPATFLLRELADDTYTGRRTRLRRAMETVAERLGADPNATAFVDNTTSAANAVLRSYPWQPGDEFLVTELGYGGVTNAVRYAARTCGAEVRVIAVPSFAATPDDVVDAIVEQLSSRTRLVVVDHITASTALTMPIAEIAAACHVRGVLVFADAAHAPGAIDVAIESYGVDWYAANLHKWWWVPRSSAVLWTAPEHRPFLHASVISWGLDQGVAGEFDLPGTRDPSPHLAAPAALAMRDEFGEECILRHNHQLALDAAALLREAWQVDWVNDPARVGPMVTVALPERLGTDTDDASRVRDALLHQHRVEVPVYPRPSDCRPGLMVRVSCQVYNDLDDVRRLATAVGELAH